MAAFCDVSISIQLGEGEILLLGDRTPGTWAYSEGHRGIWAFSEIMVRRSERTERRPR